MRRTSVLIWTFITVIIAVLAVSVVAHARDDGLWNRVIAQDDPAGKMIHEWIANLHQPDNPRLSCCGDADLYFADTVDACRSGECNSAPCRLGQIDGCGEYVAIITDNRGEEYDTDVGRVPRAVGTRVPVPKRKVKLDDGNPTEHGILFVSTSGSAICFTPLAGN